MKAKEQIGKGLIVLLSLALGSVSAQAHLHVTLTPSLLSPQLVGTSILFAATLTPSGGSPLYRFSTSFGTSGVWNVVRDYDLSTMLPWTTLQEGNYNIKVEVVDAVTGATAEAQVPFEFDPRVRAGGTPVVSRTSNPLVALYSAPPCAVGKMKVSFWPAIGGQATITSAQPCNGSTSLNFYIAGMLPTATYALQQRQTYGSTTTLGPILNFQTGAMPIPIPNFTIVKPTNSNTSTAQSMLLSSFIAGGNTALVVATDLAANPLWYYQNLFDSLDYGPFITRTTPNSTVLLLFQQGNNRRQVLREVDFAGNLIRETNATALSRQLTAMGRGTINYLSHDAVRLPNGHTLLLGTTERLLTNVQGPGTVDVLGDVILDLDPDFQVTWTWNSFDFLPTSRKAIMGETCTSQSCGPIYLAPVANDWTHFNSIFHMSTDGSLVVSARNQDWVLKINYQDGAGDGSIIWKLGRQGDFTMVSSDPWPWFSHQHDVEFDGTNYELFDDGNTRVAATGGGNSRGYVVSVDETARTATPVLLSDLGGYSQWWGSAQRLANGNYHFLNPCLGPGGSTVVPCLSNPGVHTSTSVEVQPDGTKNFTILWNSWAYRSFRLSSLYVYIP